MTAMNKELTITVAVGVGAAAVAIALEMYRRRRPPYAAAAGAPGVSLEDIAKFPGGAGLGMADAPTKLDFSPDNESITFLASPPGALAQKLFKRSIATEVVTELIASDADEASYSAEEKLRRERLRLLHTGVTDYEWASAGEGMLIPQGSRSLAFIPSPGAAARPLLDESTAGGALPAGEPVLDPKLSADGKVCCFVCDREVYACGTDGGGAPVQLTSGARGTQLSNGAANFIAQEEMDRMEGFWIAPDGASLAFEQCDESAIPLFTIAHHVDQPQQSEAHHYPFAGADNPKARIGVVPIPTGAKAKAAGAGTVSALLGGGKKGAAAPPAPVWLELGERAHGEIYISRVTWRDAKSLYVQVQDRRQTELRLLLVDAKTGASQTLLTEKASTWVNLHQMLVPLSHGRFLWASEKSGYRHLYLHNADGSLKATLTAGAWVVDHTEKGMVDEQGGRVFFLGNKADPRERHLYVTSLDDGGGAPTQLTSGGGMHAATLSRDMKHFVDKFSSAGQPMVVRLCSSADGAVLSFLFECADPELTRLRPHLAPPELVTLPSTDAKVTLYAAVYKPDAAVFGEGPHPLVVSVYGGPHVQRVADSWALTADLRAQVGGLSDLIVLMAMLVIGYPTERH